MDYLKRMQAENPDFSYAVQTDSEVNGGTVFWADATAKTNYDYFGDTVVLDTTYRSGRFRVPFAALTGFNHHGQPVLFGCALIASESESSFAWLLQRWLGAMRGPRRPVSITTDPDPPIRAAVSQVLPETRHRFSKWAVLREARERLSRPDFDAELRKCVEESETVGDFESAWDALLRRYGLSDDEWLGTMYAARERWVPVYMKDVFFAELSGTAEAAAGLNMYFDGFVTPSTTIQTLVRGYEKAVVTWQENELKADHDTNNTMPVLKTPSPMEKQAAKVYTRRIFKKFQDELVETMANPATKIDETGAVSTYRVAKFGEDHKANAVSFDSSEMKASCSCQMFECSGIICKHILSVFRTKNVLTLPSHYVLKRWTREAKTVEERRVELPDNSRELVSVRYNTLRQEAIKYVEDGAKSISIYNVAMDALREAAKKVAAVKNPGPTQGTSLANRATQDSRAGVDGQTEGYPSVEEKEKKINELTSELETINQRCEVYRANLLAVLRDMEEQKLKLAVKVQNAKLSLKE